MRLNHLISLVVVVISVAYAEAGYDEVDIPFLSALKYRFQKLPKAAQCKLLVEKFREKSGDNDGKNEQVLAQVRDTIASIDSIAKPGLVKYLDECIEVLKNEENTTDKIESRIPSDEVHDQYQQSKPFEEVKDAKVEMAIESSSGGSAIREQNSELLSELESLRQKQEEKEAENRELKQKLISSESDLMEKRKENDRLKEDLGKSCDQIKVNELDQSKLTDLTDENTRYQTQISELVKSKDNIKHDLTSCLNDKQNLIDVIKSTQLESEKKLEDMEDQLVAAKKRAEIANETSQGFQEQRDRANRELSNLKARFGFCQPVYYNGCCPYGG